MSYDAGGHKDGSGAIAIKIIHTDSKWTVLADITRVSFSIGLLIFSAVSVMYAMLYNGTTLPFPAWIQFVALFVSLFVLGVLEGLQIAVVELAHKNPLKYEKIYPRAAKLLTFENKGRNVERFLMGRQVLVVFTVFVAARITTFSLFWATVPEAMIHTLMFSGFLGVILVVVVAQLTPQVLAAAYPIEFLNLPGMKIAFWACLLVEASGIAHAVWFLCVCVRNAFYKCLCGKHEKEFKDGADDFQKLGSSSNLKDVQPTMNMMDNNIKMATSPKVSHDMVDTAVDVEEIVEMTQQKKITIDQHTDEFKSHDQELNVLKTTVGNSRNGMYAHGDGKYMSPADCYNKFRNSGLIPPQFLLPPDDKDHIPPHIVAMTLLKLYTEKCVQDKAN